MDPKELAHLPEVQAILLGVDRGGFEEAVIRMLILLAESRGAVRRDRLERSAKVLGQGRALRLARRRKARGADPRAERSSSNSPTSWRSRRCRSCCRTGRSASGRSSVVEFIAGSVEEMEPQTIKTLQKMRATLGLPELWRPRMKRRLRSRRKTCAKGPDVDLGRGLCVERQCKACLRAARRSSARQAGPIRLCPTMSVQA